LRDAQHGRLHGLWFVAFRPQTAIMAKIMPNPRRGKGTASSQAPAGSAVRFFD
jgi:hypothetical protein